MNINMDQLRVYLSESADLIPVYPWNKLKEGKERGKTPLHKDWVTKEYKPTDIRKFIDNGYNVGYRIGTREIVIDMDPRNYDLEDVEENLAELFGYFDFSELLENERSVKTGGGGYHIYVLLPDSVSCEELKETVEELPGVEFKKYGRQVLCAGSKHPNGSFYSWINKRSAKVLPPTVIEVIKRTARRSTGDYVSGKGAFTGEQLYELVLSKLDPCEYSSNDRWFPLLCASHHATNGQGVDEFVSWSLEDPSYAGDENSIRARWESLWDKENSITVGTLIHEMEKFGEDTSDVKAVLTFSQDSVLDTAFDEEDEVNNIMEVVGDITTEDVFHTVGLEEGNNPGAAISFANSLHAASVNDDIIKAIRLARSADIMERERALSIIQENTKMKRGTLNSVMKSIGEQVSDDLGRVIAEKTLKHIFNEGKHLMLPPSGVLYRYNGKYWHEISDDFLGKIVTTVYDKLKKKMEIGVQENSLINQTTSITRRLVATSTDRLHRTGTPLPIINCANGELVINPDGSHQLRPHNYRSGMLQCLGVDYNPAARAPLFMQTIHEIFADFIDSEDMVRHIGELFGYALQPNKNIASWWLFRGPGGDGKSTLLSVLGGILLDAQIKSTTRILSMNEEHGSNNHTSASLVGKLNVVIEELPAGYLLKDAGVKMLSETTKMDANPKFGRHFQFMYCGLLIMCSNKYPATRDLSHGMLRRANVIPFNRQFTSHGVEDTNRVRDILENKEEMSGVLNFFLEGLQRLRSRGRFEEPFSCTEAKEDWLNSANHVVRFFRECCEKDDMLKGIPVADVKKVYHEWCMSNDLKPKGLGALVDDLGNLGALYKTGGGNIRKLYGIRLKVTDFDGMG